MLSAIVLRRNTRDSGLTHQQTTIANCIPIRHFPSLHHDFSDWHKTQTTQRRYTCIIYKSDLNSRRFVGVCMSMINERGANSTFHRTRVRCFEISKFKSPSPAHGKKQIKYIIHISKMLYSIQLHHSFLPKYYGQFSGGPNSTERKNEKNGFEQYTRTSLE